MYKMVTFHRLEEIIFSAGFEKIRQSASHVIYRHPSNRAIITLPYKQSQKEIPAAYIIMIKRVLTENGMIKADQFERMLTKR